MGKIQVIIIEDEFFAANHLRELLNTLGYSVVEVFQSGEDFLRTTNWNFDAAIVDIFLSGQMTGLDVAEKLNERLKPYIFLTANEDAQTLKAAAQLEPKAYISKPFNSNDIRATLEIISHRITPKIQVRSAHGVEELHPSEILFIRSDSVYIEIITIHEKIVQRKLLKEIEQELPSTFIRVHRSYIINTAHIDSRTATTVMINGHEIPISRNFRENLTEK